jgi:uncharacterized protein
VLSIDDESLRLQLVINGDKAKLISIDQGNAEIPINLVVDKSTVSFAVDRIHVTYVGEVSGDNIVGKFDQAGTSSPLTFSKGEAVPSKPARKPKPQDPVAIDYIVEDVSFPGGAADVTLAGTITKPRGNGKFPAVVLVTGSGPQNRDEEIVGHRPFAVLADALTKAGVLVLRFDDRGLPNQLETSRLQPPMTLQQMHGPHCSFCERVVMLCSTAWAWSVILKVD